MSEKNSQPAPLPAAGKTAAGANPPGASPGAAPGVPVAPPAPAAKPAALFGGHKGGRKKRKDGLVAGSPEAIEADRKKNALRMANNRAQARITGATNLPTPLPSAAVAVQSAGAPLAGGASPVPVSSSLGVVAPTVPVGTVFVPWTARLLERPAKLLTKIIDRARLWQLSRKVKALNLGADAEKKVLADFEWKDSAMADFNNSLAIVAEIELNKRQVGGSENSHLINLGLSAGELALAHFMALQTLEKMAIESQGATANRGQKT